MSQQPLEILVIASPAEAHSIAVHLDEVDLNTLPHVCGSLEALQDADIELDQFDIIMIDLSLPQTQIPEFVIQAPVLKIALLEWEQHAQSAQLYAEPSLILLYKDSQGAYLTAVEQTLRQRVIGHKAYKHALDRSQAEMQAVFSSAALGVIFADVDGTVCSFNDLARTNTLRINGHQLSVGQSIYNTVQSVDQHIFRSYFHAASKGHSKLLARTITSHDGIEEHYEFRFHPITMPNGEIVGVSYLSDNVTDRRLAEKALEQSESRYRAVIENQIELVCRFLPDTTLTFVNPAYCEAFDTAEADLIGRPFLDLLPASGHQAILDSIEHMVTTGKSQTYERAFVKENGERRWQRWYDHPIFDDGRAIVEFQSVGIDITERKEAELALRHSLEREKELGDLKSRFVSMASHEFRTPLATIQAASDSLRNFLPVMSQNDINTRLHRIQTQISNMISLLNDVLMIGKAQAGAVEFTVAEVDIVSLAKDIIDEIKEIGVYANEISLQVPQPELLLEGDARLLRQVITNLLTNACKYSPEDNMVQLTIEVDVAGDVQIAVRDEGIGIPPPDQKHLFTAFHRGTNVGTIPGTGLGLAITKHAVDLHHGELKHQSVVNQGTTFYVSLPRYQATTEEQPNDAHPDN